MVEAKVDDGRADSCRDGSRVISLDEECLAYKRSGYCSLCCDVH